MESSIRFARSSDPRLREIGTASPSADGSYGAEPGLISSFPVRAGGSQVEIVPNLELNAFSRAKIVHSTRELGEERAW